VLSLNSPWTQA